MHYKAVRARLLTQGCFFPMTDCSTEPRCREPSSRLRGRACSPPWVSFALSIRIARMVGGQTVLSKQVTEISTEQRTREEPDYRVGRVQPQGVERCLGSLPTVL